jgi:hypothetical protein
MYPGRADMLCPFGVGRFRAKGGRSFAGTCAMYEKECRARRTQRKVIFCDAANVDRALAASPPR